MATNAAVHYLPYIREQADLLHAMYGRHDAAPLPIVALRAAAEGPATEPCQLPHVDPAACTLFRNCPHCGRDLPGVRPSDSEGTSDDS